MREAVEDLRAPALEARAREPAHLRERLPALRVRVGREEIGEALDLRQVHPPVPKRAPRELAALGEAVAWERAEGGEHGGDDRRAAVHVQLGDVLAGERARRGEPEDERRVEPLVRARREDLGQRRHPRHEPAERRVAAPARGHPLQGEASARARHADHRDARAHARAGRDGKDRLACLGPRKGNRRGGRGAVRPAARDCCDARARREAPARRGRERAVRRRPAANCCCQPGHRRHRGDGRGRREGSFELQGWPQASAAGRGTPTCRLRRSGRPRSLRSVARTCRNLCLTLSALRHPARSASRRTRDRPPLWPRRRRRARARARCPATRPSARSRGHAGRAPNCCAQQHLPAGSATPR